MSGFAAFGLADAVALVAGCAVAVATVVIVCAGLVAAEADGCADGDEPVTRGATDAAIVGAAGAVETVGGAMVVAALFVFGEELLNASVATISAPAAITPPATYSRFDGALCPRL